MDQQVNIILTGSDCLATSALLKSICTIHGDENADTLRKHHKKLIYSNLIRDMQNFIRKLKSTEHQNTKPLPLAKMQSLLDVNTEALEISDGCIIEVVKDIWNDGGIQEYCQSFSNILHKNSKYFLGEIDRLIRLDYLPTDEDLLHLNVETSLYLLTATIGSKDKFRVKILDISKNISDIDSWTQRYGTIATLVFAASLTAYEEYINDKNQLSESLATFENIINNRLLVNSPIVLLLVKTNLLEDKLNNTNLVTYLPEYDGPKQDAIAAREFILKKYIDQNTNKERIAYSHFCDVIDENIMAVVVAAIKDAIFQSKQKM